MYTNPQVAKRRSEQDLLVVVDSILRFVGGGETLAVGRGADLFIVAHHPTALELHRRIIVCWLKIIRSSESKKPYYEAGAVKSIYQDVPRFKMLSRQNSL